MFKVSQSDTFFWPVEVQVAESGGKFSKQTFEAEFKRISQERYKELIAEIGAKDSEMTDVKLCAEVVCGWKAVNDGDGELPFSDSNLEKILNIDGVAAGIVKAFFESRSGGKVKN